VTSRTPLEGERRRAWRFPARLEMKFQSGSAVTRDVSASGVLFETQESFAPGEAIRFSFNLNHLYPDAPVHLECEGKIVRVKRLDGRIQVAATIESYSFDPLKRPGVQMPIPWLAAGGPTASGAPSQGGPALLPSRSPRRRETGFSTTEMMVAAAVSAILAMIAITMVNDALQTGRTRGAAHQVAAAMQLARQYAVSNFATYTVSLTGSTIGVSCTATCPPSPPGETAEPIVQGATTSTPATPISFGPLGISTTPNIVTVSYPGAPNWQVQVTGAGRVRVCTPTCT
jgi:Tfp pilus assembly protein FimT